jgi:hypothetical protein
MDRIIIHNTNIFIIIITTKIPISFTSIASWRNNLSRRTCSSK